MSTIEEKGLAEKSADAAMILVTWNAQVVHWTERGELRHGPIAGIDRRHLVFVERSGPVRTGVTPYHQLERTALCAWRLGDARGVMSSLTMALVMDRIVTVRGSDGYHFCAEPGGRVVRDRATARFWETFTLIDYDPDTVTDVLLAEAVAINAAVTHGDGQSERAPGVLAEALKRPWSPSARAPVQRRLCAVRAEILVDLGRWGQLGEIAGPQWDFHGSSHLQQMAADRAAIDAISVGGVQSPSGAVDRGMTEPNDVPAWIGFSRGSSADADHARAPGFMPGLKAVRSRARRCSLPLRAWPDTIGGVIRNARVTGGDYTCYASGDGVFRYSRRERSWFNDRNVPAKAHPFNARLPLGRLHGLCVMVGGHPNYFHNIIEFMINYFYVAKMRSLWTVSNQYAAQRLSKATLILSKPRYRFHTELLEILDLSGAECFFLEDDSTVACDELVLLPQAISATGNVRDLSAVEWLQACIWNKTGPAGPPRRLYISRDDAGKRRVANEDEVRKLVERYGFEFIRLSQLPLLEQFALFRDAEIVMGPHGAGFANLVATERPCTFIEFLPVGPPRWSYYLSLAEGLGHRYTGFDTVCLNDNHDMTVETAALEALIQGITASPRGTGSG